jgi:hypothetical protein
MIQRIITSSDPVVVAVIVKEDPEAHVPVALPSRERVPVVGFGIVDEVSTERHGAAQPVIGELMFS